MANIKPIQTTYAGIKFRSRIEARWAFVFDRLNIDWEYEREGFELPSGWYLPDFYLRGIGAAPGQESIWFEVKGKPPTGDEEKKAAELANATGEDVLIAFGQIPKQVDPYDGAWDTTLFYANYEGGVDHHYQISACPKCHKLGFVFTFYAGRICLDHVPERERMQWEDAVLIKNALNDAAAERFEGGSRGDADVT